MSVRPVDHVSAAEPTSDAVGRVFRRESGAIVASLIHSLGDFDLAEDAVQDAFVTALAAWPARGLPADPGAWIRTVARNRAIDRLRRDRVLASKVRLMDTDEVVMPGRLRDTGGIEDDRLRLMFTCCHPALSPQAQVALTLRLLGGLQPSEIAAALLVPEATLAKRLVRAKQKIRAARIPYAVPARSDLPLRLPSVLETLYLVFREGYAATHTDAVVRRELCDEAIRLARMTHVLLPDELEPAGLLALMLLQDSRRDARQAPDGTLVLLEEQDRTRWHHSEIAEGVAILNDAIARGANGPYTLEAAIAREHAVADRASATNWPQILALYDRLLALAASPVVELNRAVALAMVEGPAAGLAAMERIAGLDRFHLYHAARADLLRRLGRRELAIEAYRAALGLASQPAERRFLSARLEMLSAG
jgi:RNA polymerase sigma-70 factor (ECF subfamily)